MNKKHGIDDGVERDARQRSFSDCTCKNNATNAVITDQVPTGFVFLDASNGGQLVGDEVVWTFPTLETSGSVSFRTTVDPETIDRANPTVNIATIDSDDTPPDEGEDDVTDVEEPPPQGGTPTLSPSLPNTAAGFGTNGEP